MPGVFVSGGSVTLNVVDLSSNNPAADFAAALRDRDAAICKATEGVSYVNPTLAGFLRDWRATGKPCGTYHFARPANDPVAEARWYVSKAAPLPGEWLVLDFEPYNQTTIEAQWATWVVAFLEETEALTGIPACPIYLNADMASRIRKVATAAEWATIIARPLWKASYTATVGDPLGWPKVTCWQWTDTPLDQDLFYGTADDWRALGAPTEDSVTPQEIQAVVDGVLDAPIVKMPAGNDKTSLRLTTEWTQNLFDGLTARIVSLEATVKALSTPPPAQVDLDAIAKAVADENARRQQA